MRILAIERPVEGVDQGQFTAELAAAEARRVWDLLQAGTLRELFFRDDQSSAVLVLECTDATEAATVIESLPMVQAGVIEFELIPLRAYPGFARLFADA
jgi:muconolactone delta-isomerase